MTNRLKRVDVVLEWSPSKVTAYSRTGSILASADSIASLRGQVSGNAVLVLSRRSTYVKPARLPNAKSTELSAIISVQAAQLFPNVQGQLAQSFLSTSDIDSEGRLSVLTAAPVELLERLAAQCEAIGLRLQGSIAGSLGSALICKELGLESAAVIESTPEGIAIDIVAGGSVVYSRVAAPGADLATETDRTFAAAGEAPSCVVAAPGAPVAQPERVSAMGSCQAIIQNLDSLETTLLEPPLLSEKREKAQVSQRARLAALMALAACGVVAVVWDGRDRAEAVFQRGRVEYANAIRAVSKQRDAQSAKTTKASGIAIEVRRAFEPSQSASDVLTELGNEAPTGVWLTGITFERGKDLSLRGTAVSNDAIGAFVDQLNLNPRFRDVKLAFANQALIETTSVVQFSIAAHVVGNFPAVKPKKEGGRK